jgi:stress response protein SCP2
MLPDGAHLRSEDWTIFYLNQTGQHAQPSHNNENETVAGNGLRETLFVMNCVKMKEDKSVRRYVVILGPMQQQLIDV